MRAGWCVYFLNTLESAGTEAPFKTRERWPQATVDERHLAQDEPTDEDVARATDCPSEREELMTSGLTPPASSWLAPKSGAHQARNGAASGLEHDAMVSDEAKRLCRSHGYSARLYRITSVWGIRLTARPSAAPHAIEPPKCAVPAATAC
jgi:hypothetical protein